MTETVKLMITHIFRPSPSPQNCIFLIYGPIFIRFGINGPDINVKWLTQLNWWLSIFSGTPMPTQVSPSKIVFIYGLIIFGINGKWLIINGKWLKRLNWWLPIFSGPPPSPQNCVFLIYGPIFIRFGTNGPDINGKWLTQLNGKFPPKTDNSHPRPPSKKEKKTRNQNDWC